MDKLEKQALSTSVIKVCLAKTHFVVTSWLLTHCLVLDSCRYCAPGCEESGLPSVQSNSIAPQREEDDERERPHAD